MVKPILPTNHEIRRLHFLPEDLQVKPEFPESVKFQAQASITLGLLFGLYKNTCNSVNVFPWNALKVSTYGSGYTNYETLSDTVPDDYTDTMEISDSTNPFHRFDVLIESEDACIRFYNDLSKSWLGDIPLTVGYHSMEFSSTKIQIKKRSSTAGTFSIVAYK